MKEILCSLLLLLSILFASCEEKLPQDNTIQKAKQGQEYVKVGALNANGKAILQLDIAESIAISNLETEILKETGVAVKLETIAIKYNNDLDEYNELIRNPAFSQLKFEDYQIYSIMGESVDGRYKTAYKVEEINGGLYVRTNGPMITVSCTGCAIGCSPKMLGNANICYPECPESTVSCIKNETVTTGQKLSVFGTNYVVF